LLLAQLVLTRYLVDTTSTITDSSHTPYKGAVVINGVLYCPYSTTRSAASAQQSQLTQTKPQSQLRPKPKPKPDQQVKMQGPNFGALGATFTVVRGMQAISLISIIGMTANFIAEMIAVEQAPPNVLVGTLSVTCIAVLYCAITYILYFDSLLPFLINCGMDGLLLIAVIVVAVTIGKPLSYLNCAALPGSGDASSFLDSVGQNMSKINYWVWAGASKSTCYEMKAIWGLSIALCILFAFSSIVSVCLWRHQKVGIKKDLEAK